MNISLTYIAVKKYLQVKHYRTFNKKYHIKRTLERSVIINGAGWKEVRWGMGVEGRLKLALRDPNPRPKLS